MPKQKKTNTKELPICPECSAWMLEYPERPGWWKCSCGFMKKIFKRTVETK